MVRRYPDQWNWLGFQRDGRKPKRKMGMSEPISLNQKDRTLS
jgi:hypothetical protein